MAKTSHRLASVVAALAVWIQPYGDAGAETVTLPNGQSYEVETDRDGEPVGVENSQVAFNFLGLQSRASLSGDALEWAWLINLRLKRNRSYRVTVTTPYDETLVDTFDVSGRGDSLHPLFTDVDSENHWDWLEQPGTSWIPFAFLFDEQESDEEFELTQWTKFTTQGKYRFIRDSYTAAALEFPRDHPSNESVVPPFDDRAWEIGSQAVVFPQVVSEFVLTGETIDDWSELITVQSFIGAQESSSVDDFVRRAHDSLLEYCPSAMWNVILQSVTGAIVESRSENCVGPADSDDQYEIVRLVPGQWAMHRVAYTTKREPYLPESKRSEWIDRMSSVELGLSEWTANLSSANLSSGGQGRDLPLDAGDDEALIYLLREQERSGELAVFVDGQPAASLPALSYAAISVEPGWHLLWGDAGSAWFELEAGREYFLRLVNPGIGWNWLVEDLGYLNGAIAARNLARIDPSDGDLDELLSELDRYERVRRRAGDPPGSSYPAEVKARYRSEPPGPVVATIFGLGRAGTLTVTEAGVDYVGRDEEFTIPIESIQLATIIGPELDWLVVEFTQGDGVDTAFFGSTPMLELNDVLLAIQNARDPGLSSGASAQ